MTGKYSSNVKKIETEEEYSEYQIQELIKCSNNPEYFIENYVKVNHPDKGEILFKLYPHQKRMLKAVVSNRMVVCKMPRQAGKTSFCSAYILWYTIFKKGKTSGIVSNKESSAKEVLKRIKDMYESVPSGLKPGALNYEQTFIVFENKSRVIAAATSKNSFRSGTINGVLLADEFAHVSKNLQNEFGSSNYPTISASKQAKIIIISTPLGMYDLFHELYIGAKKKLNNFKYVSVRGSEHPERDEKWLEEQKKSLGPLLFRQEVLCQFLGSSNTTI